MLVKCPECSTKYNLDKSLLGKAGAKVRCTRCEHVFYLQSEEKPAQEQPAPPSESSEEFETGFEETIEVEPDTAGVEEGEDESENLFDDFEVEEVEEGQESAIDSEFDEFEEFEPEENERSGVRLSASDDLEVPRSEDTIIMDKVAESAPSSSEQPDTSYMPMQEEKEEVPPPPPIIPKKKSRISGTKILFSLLFLVLAIAAASYFYSPLLSKYYPDWMKQAVPEVMKQEKEIKGRAERTDSEVRLITLKNVKQYFKENPKIGKLFVIEGTAINNYPDTREMIEIEAALYGPDGEVLKKKDYLCGNKLTEFQLEILSQEEMEKVLTAKSGIMINNTNLKPGESVPFMAIFYTYPDTVYEYGVRVIDAKIPPDKTTPPEGQEQPDPKP